MTVVVFKGVQGSVRVCVQGGAYIPAGVCVCACMWVRGSVLLQINYTAIVGC